MAFLHASAPSHAWLAVLQLGPWLPAPELWQEPPPAAQTWHVPLQLFAQQIFVEQLALEHSQWLFWHSFPAEHAFPSGCLPMQLFAPLQTNPEAQLASLPAQPSA